MKLSQLYPHFYLMSQTEKVSFLQQNRNKRTADFERLRQEARDKLTKKLKKRKKKSAPLSKEAVALMEEFGLDEKEFERLKQ